MAQAILDQLKNPIKPSTQSFVSVQYKKPETKSAVKLDTKIVDKRDETYDRNKILAKLKKKLGVENKTQVEKVEKDFDDLSAIEKLETLAEIQSQKSIDKKIVDTTIADETSRLLTDENEGLDKKTKALANLSEISEKLLTKPETMPITKTKTNIILKPKTSVKKILKPQNTVVTELDIDIEQIKDKLPEKEPQILIQPEILIEAPTYYMNNREIFINFMERVFHDYKEEINNDTYNCNSKKEGEFNLLTHQKIVRDYINIYSPYRGLLLYHGLGSGKTCSSIAIAEGLKTDKKILIMTPASLETNYKEELKKCGDKLYKKNQFWQKINTKDNPTLIEPLSFILSLPIEFIVKQNGAWFVNIKEEPNYYKLNSDEQKELDGQLEKMISYKYEFLRYNGILQPKLDLLVEEARSKGVNNNNPFSNKVIIIDEAHNFVSRIVNKLSKKNKPVSIQLYDYLRKAENSKIILLTGTPIINYPNEIGIAMNILRGTINTWKFKIKVNINKKLTENNLFEILNSDREVSNILDYFQYKATSNTVIITRNPYGFFSVRKDGKYKGVELGENGNIDDATFIKLITEILDKNNITIIPSSVEVIKYNCLPDTLDGFKGEFIDQTLTNLQNMNKFKSRIMGLVSYFPDIDALLPRYDKSKDLHIIKIDMSDFQFSIYEEARVEERKTEQNNAKKRAQSVKKDAGGGEVYDDATSTYRIFSRVFCNFVFPRPDIRRPLPRDGIELSNIINDSAEEDLMDAISILKKN